MAPHTPGSLLTVMSAGTVSEGFSVSFTVTVKVSVELLPWASVAVTVTVVTPTGKVAPEAGLLASVTPGQLSVAVGVKVTAAPHWPAVALATMFAGRVSAGFSVSLIVTAKEQL